MPAKAATVISAAHADVAAIIAARISGPVRIDSS